MNGLVKRAFKFRFHPSEAQTVELSRTFGCVRKVYNLALRARAEAWTQRGERVGYEAMSALLTAWKRTEELAFLGEVSSVPLQQALRHLQCGFSNFFAQRARFPRFKSRKKSRASAEYTRSAFRWRDRTALARAQRALCRKQKGSSNRAKARVRVARIHARYADRRTDFLHKVTTRLVRDTHTLVIEDLVVSNMVGNRRLARAIGDAGWRQFRQLVQYKARWYGRDVITVDRWFPSAKLCSVCGALAAEMPLHLRTWTCGCGATHDRDVNAVRNILAAGPAVTVCGAGVRPQRNPPGGQSATKQKTLRREL